MTISIIVPCYNERDNIPNLLTEFEKVNAELDGLELILVENGSKDDTRAVIREKLKDYPFARMVCVDVNQGYGYGIKQGLRAATGDYVGWLHADLQISASEVCQAQKKLTELGCPHNIFLKGIRRNRPMSDRFFTLGMSVYESFLLKCKLYDINAQPTIFSMDLYERWEKAPDDFSLDLYAYYVAVKNGCMLCRWPVKQQARVAGQSSWNNGFSARVKLIRRTINFSKNLKKIEGVDK